MSRRLTLFFLLSIFFYREGSTQLVIQPVRPFIAYPIKNKNSFYNQRINAIQSVPLSLPFFDDFSEQEQFPSFRFWETKGGVWINDQMGVDPPSIGVATFDGINAMGRPYNFEAPLSIGSADTLTSLPINLTGLENSNVYLSFYSQPEGIGDPPELEDSIVLQFKNSSQQWITVWKRSENSFTPFKQEMIAVNQPDYFHVDFQFRFRLFSKQSGPFDVWNIDYVYLDKNRTPTDLSTVDVAISHISTSALKKYTAMPFHQFKLAMQDELADSLSIYYLNHNSIFNVVKFRCDWRDSLNHQSLGILGQDTRTVPELSVKQLFEVNPDFTLIPTNLDSLYLTYRFILTTGEAGNPGGFQKNDTAQRTTILHNYYSYDDGSAEYSVALNQKFSKCAYQFTLNEPDILTHIDVSFVQMIQNVENENFNLIVWKSIGEKDTILYRRNFMVRYPTLLNQFTRYELGDYIPLKGTFYIGWEQTSDNMIMMGFDGNTDSRSKIFYNIGSGWVPFQQDPGSVMMHPVFKKSKVLGIEDPVLSYPSTLFYPNPASKEITIDETVKEVIICDLMGKEVGKKQLSFDDHVLSIAYLNNGVYSIFLKTLHTVEVQKLIIAK